VKYFVEMFDFRTQTPEIIIDKGNEADGSDCQKFCLHCSTLFQNNASERPVSGHPVMIVEQHRFAGYSAKPLWPA
jgi:hypothetical protein